jgi:hypothetical protein
VEQELGWVGHLYFVFFSSIWKGKIAHQWTNGNDGYPLRLPGLFVMEHVVAFIIFEEYLFWLDILQCWRTLWPRWRFPLTL